MDQIEIVPYDGEPFCDNEGSDIDGEDMLEEFEDENEENDERNDQFDVPNFAANGRNEGGRRAAEGPPVGGAPTQWTELLTPVPNLEFTGKNNILLYSDVLLCHIIHFHIVLFHNIVHLVPNSPK